MANFERQFFSELENFCRQGIDNHVALFHLEIAQALAHAAFQFVSRIRIAAIEIKRQRFGIAVVQAVAPTGRNNERRLHAVA